MLTDVVFLLPILNILGYSYNTTAMFTKSQYKIGKNIIKKWDLHIDKVQLSQGYRATMRREFNFKGYLHYKMITSQNVPLEVQVKNIFFL